MDNVRPTFLSSLARRRESVADMNCVLLTGLGILSIIFNIAFGIGNIFSSVIIFGIIAMYAHPSLTNRV